MFLQSNACWLSFPYYQYLQVMSLIMYCRTNWTITPSSISHVLFVSRQYMLIVRFSILCPFSVLQDTFTCPEILWTVNQLAEYQVPVTWKGLAQWVPPDLLFLYSRLRFHLFLVDICDSHLHGWPLCEGRRTHGENTRGGCTLSFVDNVMEYWTTEPHFSYCWGAYSISSWALL